MPAVENGWKEWAGFWWKASYTSHIEHDQSIYQEYRRAILWFE